MDLAELFNASATVYGTQSLDTSDLSSFTAFADLTASDVQGWVEAAMTADTVTEMKSWFGCYYS